VPGISTLFIGRFPDIDVVMEREAAMAVLAPLQQMVLEKHELGSLPLVRAEQIHGAVVATVTSPSEKPLAGIDGLMTKTRGITLGISVADCAPVWLVAKDGSAGALLHSGKKGTELGIVTHGIQSLCSISGKNPADLTIVIGPCIRTPCYEVDFATEIRRQATRAGVIDIHDDGICTACHPDRYYSYRREKGLTGRMLATLTLLP
jgi:hypothetical protein